MYKDKDKQVNHSAQKDKHAWPEKQVNQAKVVAACNDIQAVYQVTKRITGSTKANPGAIKFEDGKLLSKGEDKLARWAVHFQEVLNHPGPMIVEKDPENPADSHPIYG